MTASRRARLERVPISDQDLGRRLGDLIVRLVDLLAEVDGVSRDEVLEELFAGWWADRLERQQPS